MSPTDNTNSNHRTSRFSGRPPQTPMGPRLRAQRSPNSPEDLPRDSSSTPSPINLVATPLPVITEKPSMTPPPSPTKSFHSEPKPTPKRFMLTPPPKVNFESAAVQWKGLPLEAALWTFNSQELQELVSRAIRLTARESFIRLLSLENLDRALPAEAERLNASKSATQSKYRFLVHRRTMLLQAITSSADSSSSTNNNANKNNDAVSQLVVQLAQTTAECDRVLEELLLHSDQLAQIEQMINLHWSSALAVALRKLNKSHARRSSELQVARGRIEQLEAELDDAWREAERLAKKMDSIITEDITTAEFDIEEAIIGKAEKVVLPSPPTPAASSIGTLMQVEPIPVFSPLSAMTLPRTPFTETEGHGHISQPTPQHTNQAPIQTRIKPRPPHLPLIQHPSKDISDTASILSNKSTHSGRSPDSAYPTQFNLVTSARKRSSRTSKSSLRLPRSQSQSRSRSRTGTPYNQGQARDDEDQPPVPDIPFEFSQGPPFPLAPSPKPSSNIVWPGATDMSSHSISHLRTHSRNASSSFRRYRRTSLDDVAPPRATTRFLERGRRDSGSSYTPTVTVDDIHVPPPSYHQHNEIQVIPHTPTSPSTPVFTLPPMPALRSLKKRFSNSRSQRSTMTDPRKRLTQSVETALDAVAVPLSPSPFPTSLPLPPSPLTPSSLDTDMTEQGRGNEGEQRGRERRGGPRSRLFSGAGMPSWLHPDSHSNGERGDRDRVWRRAVTASPSRERGEEEGGYEQANMNESVSEARYGNGNGIESGRGTTKHPVKPYEKLKTLTKRYSLNFPLSMFVDRARPGTGMSSGMTAAGAGTGTGPGWRPTSHASSPG